MPVFIILTTTPPSFRTRAAHALASLVGGKAYQLYLASIVQPIADNSTPAWGALSNRPNERTIAEVQELYTDALTAWRKNPLAKRIVDITTDYVIGDGITLSSPYSYLNSFIEEFWYHPENNVPNRLQPMVEELTRSGNYLPILFTNPHDGLSYIRVATVDQLRGIHNLPNDWETITQIDIAQYDNLNLAIKPYYTAAATDKPAGDNATISLYTINRPEAAHLGEGDLTTVIPWLMRYSRMLEDRIRLNWAVRMFLWFVKVPSGMVAAKQEQYKSVPEPGTVIVHDDAEEWNLQSPSLHANDASHDLSATRRMVYSGTGYPPNWYGEQGSNLAEAKASTAPAERHLRRRQLHIIDILRQQALLAYHLRQKVRGGRKLPISNTQKLITANTTDLSREDNAALAEAAERLSTSYKNLILETAPQSRTLTQEILTLFFKFAGEPKEKTTVDRIVDEMFTALEKGTPTP